MLDRDLLYRHRGEGNRVDVVDLDQNGTAAPFIDGAVQAVNDGGEQATKATTFVAEVMVIMCVR